MSRKHLKNKLPPFVPMQIALIESEAFKTLTGNSAKALIFFTRIEGKLKRAFGGDFNGNFDFTYSEAEKFGFARRTFSRIIEELIEKGFIDIVSQGGKRGCGFSNTRTCWIRIITIWHSG